MAKQAQKTRRRHVKCDETKPGCQRCIKWRGHCEGYEEGRLKSQTPENKKKSPGPVKSESKQAEKIKLPRWYREMTGEAKKLLVQPDHLRATTSPTGTAPPRAKRVEKAIRNQQPDVGDSCKAVDRTSAARGFDGFDEAFWRETVPQLLRQNASVWYANLAIHALIDALKSSWNDDDEVGTGDIKNVGGGEVAAASYRRALRYHGLALGQLRKEAINRDSLQSATLCCLFFVIFEMLNDDDKAAQAHMYNGCKMMDELQRNSQGRTMTNAEVDAMLHREIQKALYFVALQLQGSGSGEDAITRSSQPPSPLVKVSASEDGGSEVASNEEWYGFDS